MKRGEKKKKAKAGFCYGEEQQGGGGSVCMLPGCVLSLSTSSQLLLSFVLIREISPGGMRRVDLGIIFAYKLTYKLTKLICHDKCLPFFGRCY